MTHVDLRKTIDYGDTPEFTLFEAREIAKHLLAQPLQKTGNEFAALVRAAASHKRFSEAVELAAFESGYIYAAVREPHGRFDFLLLAPANPRADFLGVWGWIDGRVGDLNGAAPLQVVADLYKQQANSARPNRFYFQATQALEGLVRQLNDWRKETLEEFAERTPEPCEIKVQLEDMLVAPLPKALPRWKKILQRFVPQHA